jgi:hypothetical protein
MASVHRYIMALTEEIDMKRVLAVSILLNGLFATILLAQQRQYPHLYNVIIQANTSFDTSEGMFHYSYTLTNSTTNIGRIASFEIDISRKPHTLKIDTAGLRFKNDGYTEKNFKLDFAHLAGKIIPVGFLQTPPGMWDGGNTNALTASFDAVSDADFIAPGKSEGGFEMISRGLPSIRACFLAPYFDVISLFPDPNDTTIKYYVPPVDSVRQAMKFHGWTVGPTAPPIIFVASIWCDTLISYINQSKVLSWIKNQLTANKYLGYFGSVKASLLQNNNSAARTTLGQVLADVNIDSTRNLTSEAYALIRYNTEYLLSRLPTNPAPRLAVRLVNSGGAALTSGSLQYYEGSWKDAVNNGDGTFSVNTSQTTTSLRMTYAYGFQQKNNVSVSGGSVTFQTVNAQVKLQNSQGMAIDTGSVQYYAGAWRSFGTTSNGTASMELLPANYSFRMTYAYGSNDKQQDIGGNPTVVFQTVSAAVQLQNSQGTLMDAGTVQYYAGSWRAFGSTTNGVATKEILPNNYSFRMTYAYASKDLQQNIRTNPTVVFSTVNATVQLKNSLGNLIDAGTVQYYAGAWRDFGTTTNGVATKELLPNNYSFRMTYEFVSNDKQQDIGTNGTVSFATVLCKVRVANSAGQMVSGAVVSYYSGAWRQIGTTVDGQITKELLPANLSFRASYGGRSQDKQQNLSTNAVVDIVVP